MLYKIQELIKNIKYTFKTQKENIVAKFIASITFIFICISIIPDNRLTFLAKNILSSPLISIYKFILENLFFLIAATFISIVMYTISEKILN